MTIGIFGGTFNPVHWGHVRTASEIKNVLGLEKMLMLPCHIPPHREQPDVSADSSLAMLKLAINEFPELEIDERELKRDGPSYSVETLQTLHDDIPDKSFALCVGADAFLQFNTWHRWRDIFDLAHLLVAHRPGWSMNAIIEQLPDELREEMSDRLIQDAAQLKKQNSGSIMALKVTEIDISSSDIRQRVANNESISGLVPVAVETYIKKHELYRY